MSDPTAHRTRRITRIVVTVVLLALLLLFPFVATTALLQTGLLVLSGIIAAIGLNLLYGSTGQLSLGHAFFVAVGAYAYGLFAGHDDGYSGAISLGLPPLLSMVLAVCVAGLFGLLFSPISSRLRGASLGVASLALVFIGSFLMNKLVPITGGGNGREIQPFDLFGFSFTDENPFLTIAGRYFGGYERLWVLGVVLVIGAYVVAKRLLAGRPGRAFEAVRDGEVQAAVTGIDVRRTKATAFVISSLYAGLAGVFLGLAVNHIVADTFTLSMSIAYLAAILIGGLGSVGGAIVGATFVFALPQFLLQYGEPLLRLTPGLEAGQLAAYIYGAAVILILLFEPEGLTRIFSRLWKRIGRRSRGPGASPDPSDGADDTRRSEPAVRS